MYNYLGEDNKIIASESEIDKSLIQLDENIAFAISDLNMLNYPTKSSCEGHFGNLVRGCFSDQQDNDLELLSFEYAASSYITFENGVRLPSAPEGWTWAIDDMTYDENDNPLIGHWETISAHPPKEVDTPYKYYLFKFKALTDLYKWIDKIKQDKGQ